MSMTKGKSKIIITSALPYVNNVPHLGTMVCVLSSDVYARYLRLKKKDVLFVCGTDEHGTTAEVKAAEEGVTPRQLVDKYFKIHKQVYEWFECKFDCFVRTSSDENKEVTIDIFNKLDKNGYIKEDEIEQAYCTKCDKFLADRFVEGICPFCKYDEARGDQCEKCGRLLNPTDLNDARCKVCSSAPEIRKTKHLFINLPKLKPKLEKWVFNVEDNWTTNAKTLTHGWFKEGLKPRCITRDLKWGIKVPKKGYENKVFYSWFDAPIGYIGITKEIRDDWKDWWLSKDSKLVQFMGKDNIPFHTILFPSFLIGTGDPYVLVSSLSVNEYLNYEGGMFSKSRSVGVFGDNVQETGIIPDVWRYYIMVNRPETADTEFLWKDFQAKNNNELVANIGNLVNRVTVFVKKFFDGKIGTVSFNADDKKVFAEVKEHEKKIEKLLDEIKLKEALREIMQIGKLANNYFQKSEPWKLVKSDKDRTSTCLAVLANVVKDLSILLEPYLPESSAKIQQMLNVSNLSWKNLGEIAIEGSHEFMKPEILFRKLEDDEIDGFSKKYAGKKDSKFPLNLKIAKILEAEPHPEADKLMILQVDLGKEKRQIVAGIKEFYDVKDLIGRNIVVVSNLKPARLRGKESKGMLLAAGKKAALLSAPKSNPGDSVFIEGVEINDGEISIDDFVKVELSIKGKKALADGKILKTEVEEITADAKDGEKIK